MQQQQMQKQEGDNVRVSAIHGNFDDAQSFLKRVFTNPDVNAYANEKGVLFSSANSINIGRLFPQIVYYVSTYITLVDDGDIGEGETFDLIVPTGTFGTILAGYFAKKMGIPIVKLICASNKNKVLADFFETGVYDMNRYFYTDVYKRQESGSGSLFFRGLLRFYGGLFWRLDAVSSTISRHRR